MNSRDNTAGSHGNDGIGDIDSPFITPLKKEKTSFDVILH